MYAHLSIHIICLDIPFPADYGGAIEEFYKLKAIHQLGVKIHLHCFEYGDRKQQPELQKYCEKVYYYRRERSWKFLFSSFPFIVQSRMHPDLLNQLQQDNFPILMDATHSSGFLNHPNLKNRIMAVRLHNIEWIYYRILVEHAVNLKEKIFFFQEYKKLRKYDAQLQYADVLSCLSQTDFEYYSDKFPDKKVQLDFVFHEHEKVQAKVGKGNYILYHGNLSLSDNYSLLIDLLSNELKHCTHPIYIAGKNPPDILIQFLKNKPNIKLLANPTNEALQQLVQEAHICLALAANPSGVKLKLINSLFLARFVISDENTLTGSGLDALVYKKDDMPLSELIDTLMQQTFTATDIDKRSNVLLEKYNNIKNAQQILQAIVSVNKG